MVDRGLGFLGVCIAAATAGCGGGAGAESTSFGSDGASNGATGDAASTPSGRDDDDATPGNGSSGGGSDEGPTGSGPSADAGSEFACEITIACHDGSAVAGAGTNSVVPIGCGGPAFALTHTIAVSTYADPEAPRAVPLLGDFDDDGNLDLLVNLRKATAAFVFAGQGDGTLAEPPAATLSGGLFAGGWGGDLGDLNGDGRLDVLLGDHTRSARAWTAAGNMVFAEARAGLPDDVWFSGGGLVDLDGDGDLDALFGADQFGSGVMRYAGDGSGGWTGAAGPAVAGSNLGHFAAADFDADGDLDVFAFGKAGPGVTAFVLRNDGGVLQSVGQHTGGTAVTSADPVQGAVGDVDCDGNVDIAAGGSIFLGGGGTWALATAVDAAQVSQLADMNGDGHLDLVTHDPAVGLALYLGDGTGAGWTLDADSGLPAADDLTHGAPLDSAYGIAIGDLDGNDALDVVRIAGYGAEYYVDVFTR